jgi:hypothetical protein
MTSLHAAAPPPQQSPPPDLRFLGQRLASDRRGFGFITFEEIDFKPPNRMLRAVFADDSVIEGCASHLRALGVSFLPDGALTLPHKTRASGHHAAYGSGLRRAGRAC